jgi:hypothetical protein
MVADHPHRSASLSRPFVAFATWSPWARLLLQAVCKPLQGRLQGASTECSAFPIDPSRVDSYDMSQPYAHRAEIDRLEQRPGSTSGSARAWGEVLAEPRRTRPLVAHCHLGLGKLYRSTGKREQAREHLTTATTMYREMGMMYWLEQAGPELRALP